MSRVLRPRKEAPLRREEPPVDSEGPRNLRKRKLDTNYYPSDVLDLTPENSESDTGSDYYQDSEAASSEEEKKKEEHESMKGKKKNNNDDKNCDKNEENEINRTKLDSPREQEMEV